MRTRLHPSDITLLRVFRAICESGGVAAAAERQNSAASTISTQLKQLEDRLGLTLCMRGRGGFAITSEGERVLESANKMFDVMQGFMHDVSKLKDTLVGELRIGILDNTISNPKFSLSQQLHQFQQHYPNVQTTVEVSVPEQLEQAVLDRRYDIGIGIKQHRLPNLVYWPIFKETEVVCCSRHHPLYDIPANELTIEHLRDSNWVLDFYRLPFSIPEVNPPSRMSYVSSIEAGLHLVLSGAYLATLPTHYIVPWVARQQIKVLLEDELSYSLDFSLIYNSGRKNNAIVANFLAQFQGQN